MGHAYSCFKPRAASVVEFHDVVKLTQANAAGSGTAAAATGAGSKSAAAASQPQSQQQLDHKQSLTASEADASCTCLPAASANGSSDKAHAAPPAGSDSSGSSNVALRPKFDPHAPQPEEYGYAAAPGMPHNPHDTGPPRPPCEDDRLNVIEHVGQLLDAAPKKELENILQLVCNIFGVSNALIALFGDRRIYINNTIGGFKEGDFPWRWSFCGWTMASEQHTVMVINDALQDARFADNKYVQEIGVRFYCGSPLVSSSGHRLGTLCFADTKPRVFDAGSLQIMCNFSELVTRELEKDIALARRQAEQAAAAKADKQQQYNLVLRTIECVTSAVLLVDTSKPDWPILHCNSGWDRLVQQCCPSKYSRDGASSSSNAQGTSNNMAGSRHQGYLGGLSSKVPTIVEAPSGALATGANNSSKGNAGSLSSPESSEFVGKALWSMLDPYLLAASGYGYSSVGSAWCPGEQMLREVRGHQSFTLRGVKLSPALGSANAQLTFRCAGFSRLEGAVDICLPTFTPDASEVKAVADALSATGPVPVIPSSATGGDSLYFVTVKLHMGPNSTGSASSGRSLGCSSIASSMWTAHTDTVTTSLSPCTNSRFVSTCSSSTFSSNGPVRLSSFNSCSGLGASVSPYPPSDHFPAVEEPQGSGRSGLVVISSVPCTPAAREPSMTIDSYDMDSFAGGSSDTGSMAHRNSSGSHIELVSDAPELGCAVGSGGGRGALSSLCAGLVCKKMSGLALCGMIAAGSYGRVYRGAYFGTKVAVKVLDGSAVLRRDEVTGFSLEALLSERLNHPNVVRTLAWAVVTGEGRLPKRQQVWGETLDPDKPSIVQNKAHINKEPVAAAAALFGVRPTAAEVSPAGPQQQLQQAAAAAAGVLAAVGGGANPQQGVSATELEGNVADEASDEDMVLGGQTWMVMEFCDKGCLQDAVERGWLRETRSCVSGEINLMAVLATAAEIASGMALLHDAGIIHGDLSAFNVMLSSQDAAASVGGRGFVAKVADFGLARTLNHTSKVVTKTYGTITHMPPETLEHGLASKAADVYSFGVLLWQMVTGSRAWAGMSHMAVVDVVCCKRLQLQFPEDAPEAFVLLGQACMAYDPAERPSFRDILDILEPINSMITNSMGLGRPISFSGAHDPASAMGEFDMQQQNTCKILSQLSNQTGTGNAGQVNGLIGVGDF
eukprot:GHRR01001502.1.p1 GENE.GHRR01001502.1~~GHRR01001502.1.p1  ORF type:complete len:1180 (+),score=462.14 GHRR01001502.1:255-3794(+)